MFSSKYVFISGEMNGIYEYYVFLPFIVLTESFLYPERTLSEAKGYLNVAFFFRVRPYVTKTAKGRTQDGQTQDGHKRGK